MIGFNAEKIRKDFPVLEKKVIYLDNACMSLKPNQVIDKMLEYYKEHTACAGRSIHSFSTHVETEVAKARNSVRKLINAKHDSEIIFTRNTTEGMNIVANTLGLGKGDEVIISGKEHNSNLVPWLRMPDIKLVIAEVNDDNTFNLENFEKCLSSKTKLVSMGHRSNLDGVTYPIKEIAKMARDNGSLMLVDGAQSAPGMEVDVRKLNADFFAFSGHKMLGPTGTGVLYGKKELLEKMDQFIVGGDTVIETTFNNYKVEELPMKFEAGLQDYAGQIGLGAASRYLAKIGLSKIEKHEIKLNKIMTDELLADKKIELIGPEDPSLRAGIFSFNIKGMDPHHVSKMLDASKTILTRSGVHCLHSWFHKRGMEGSVRASVYLYNTEQEIEVFINEVKKLTKF